MTKGIGPITFGISGNEGGKLDGIEDTNSLEIYALWACSLKAHYTYQLGK